MKTKVEDFKIGDLVNFKNGQVWKVVKAGMRGSDNRVAQNEITIYPYNDLAKEKNISMSIDLNIDYLINN